MDHLSAEEMENFQRLSDQYHADLPGPLIGEKLPISVLVTEYAQADPTFVVKTNALSATHSAFRAIKGDGQCGWRAAVYGYFENLLQLGDVGLIVQEITRLKSFEDTMRMVGIDYEVLVDLFDYTWDVFEDVRKAAEQDNKHDSVILQYFNDGNVSNAVVYHFKTMTSAYMQLRADEYEPFIPEMSIQEYRAARIDPANQEIDQIGLQGLTDAVIAPAGIGLEVSYLDRSTGNEVTPHQFTVPNFGPRIRLLYRPGHYDMIYKEDQPIQVYRQSHTTLYSNMSQLDLGQDDPDYMSYMFPDSTNLNVGQPSQQTQYMYSGYNTQPTYPDYAYNVYQHSMIKPEQMMYDQAVPQVQSQILPQQQSGFRHTSTDQLPTGGSQNQPGNTSNATQSKSASTSAPSPASSTGPVQPGHSQSPSAEPQIRLSSTHHQYKLGRHVSVPLSPDNAGAYVAPFFTSFNSVYRV